jgi:hypothetical protein
MSRFSDFDIAAEFAAEASRGEGERFDFSREAGRLTVTAQPWASDPDHVEVSRNARNGYKRLWNASPAGKASNKAQRDRWRAQNVAAGKCRECSQPRAWVVAQMKPSQVIPKTGTPRLSTRCRACLDKFKALKGSDARNKAS